MSKANKKISSRPRAVKFPTGHDLLRNPLLNKGAEMNRTRMELIFYQGRSRTQNYRSIRESSYCFEKDPDQRQAMRNVCIVASFSMH